MTLHKNDPRRNAIQTWCWGDRVDLYTDPKKAPRWVRSNGLLRDPCDVAGCKRHILGREWYVRHPFLGVVCADCAPIFGAFPPDLGPLSPSCRKPCREYVHLGKLDCPFQSCPMKSGV